MKNKKEFNFFAQTETKKKTGLGLYLMLAFACVLTAAVIAGMYLLEGIRVSDKEKEIDEIKSFLSSKEVIEKVSKVQQLEQQILLLQQYQLTALDLTDKIAIQHVSSTSLFDMIETVLPTDVQVDDLSISGAFVVMQCRTNHYESIAALWNQLNAQPFFADSYVGNISKDEEGIFSFPVEFSLNVEVLHESK